MPMVCESQFYKYANFPIYLISNAILINITVVLFWIVCICIWVVVCMKIYELILKYLWKCNEPKSNKDNHEKEAPSWRAFITIYHTRYIKLQLLALLLKPWNTRRPLEYYSTNKETHTYIITRFFTQRWY